MQILLEGWFYRWNLRCKLKGDTSISSYGTSDLQLLEGVKGMAAATGYGKDPYPMWTPLQLIPENKLPSFGLGVQPKEMMAAAADGSGVLSVGRQWAELT
jgi:hypothetical protein